MTTTTLDEITQEVRRVFGAATVDLDTDDASRVGVLVKGWPDRALYRTDRLMATLARFADDHGETEAGDAEVCQALDEANAFVCFDNR